MYQRATVRGALLVPALLTTIAYVDPGNFGTNIAAGDRYGYALVWVVVLASVSAALIQYLAASLGLATGRGLAENCADRLGRWPRLLGWAQAEVVVIMTDLAEVVGGALGLQLLFGTPLPVGALLIGAASFAILGLGHSRSGAFRPIALALLAVVAVSVLWATASLRPDVGGALHGLRPQVLPPDGLLVAVGIVGATVMPHALYFHSALSSREDRPLSKPRLWRATGGARAAAHLRRRLAVVIVGAMAGAGAVNVAILVLGASVPGHAGGSIDGLSEHLRDLGHRLPALLLGVALLAAGLASSVIGAWTGQAVMAGYLHRTVAVWKRRLVALVPPVAALSLGLDPSWALVASQVVLSLALPLTLAALVLLTGSRSVMGAARSPRVLTAAAWLVTAVITVMDLAALGHLATS